MVHYCTEKESQPCSIKDFLLYSRKYTKGIYLSLWEWTTSTCTIVWKVTLLSHDLGMPTMASLSELIWETLLVVLSSATAEN